MTYYLGIDIGTTYTAAAVWRDGRYEIASLGNRAPTIPSVVLLRDDEAVLTGEAAVRRAATEPGRVAREFKRRVGDPTPIIVGGTPYSADALMAKLLRWVVEQVSAVEGGPPAGIAVSHPANWGNYKLDLLRQAISLADLDDVATLTEPEAAAIHYASQARVEPGSVIAVYDLGGGTFDAAVLRKTDDGWAILGAPEGIERLGGVDFDQAVFHHVVQATGGAIDGLDPDDPTAQAAVARLRQDCIDAKEALSSDSDVSIPVMLPNLQTEVRLTRGEYEQMVRPALTDSITAMNRALRSAKVTPGEVTAVLLVGGSSRTPLVAEMVSSALGRPVAVDAHPKHGVALGAAITAAQARSGGTGSGTPAGPTAAAPPGPSAATPGPSGAPGVGPVAASAAAAAAGFIAGQAAADAGGSGHSPTENGGTSPATAPSPAPTRPAATQPSPGGPPAGPGQPARGGQPPTGRPTEPLPPAERRSAAGPSAGSPPGRDQRSVTVPYTGETPPDRPTERVAANRSPAGGDPGRPRGRAGGPSGDRLPPGGADGGRGGSGSRRPLLIAVAAVVVLGLVGAGAALALGGDDDDPSTADTADTASVSDGGDTADSTVPPDTTASTLPPGPFVQIDDVVLEGEQYRVNYQVIGYTPEIGAAGTLHVHFFPDTQPAATAGTNGGDGDEWFVTDEAASVVTDYTAANTPGATQMCAAVATYEHAVHTPEVLTGNCADLPT